MLSLKIKKLKRITRNALSHFYHTPTLNLESRFLGGVAAIKSQRSNYRYLSDIRQAEVRVFSQNGEDGILDYIFETCGLIKPSILEIGSGDFSECNSKFSNFLRNSAVYLVDSHEGLSQIYDKYRSRRVNSKFFFERLWIDKSNVLQVFWRAKEKLGNVDVLSLDIDGNDYWILCRLPLSELEVLVVEYNPSLSDCEPVSTVYDPHFDRTKKHFSCKYYGATLEAFDYLLSSNGFFFLGATSQGTNAFFVKNRHKESFGGVIKNLNSYKNTDSREARDEKGALSFVDIDLERQILKSLPVVDVRKS
jgi:hypothetical protein